MSELFNDGFEAVDMNTHYDDIDEFEVSYVNGLEKENQRLRGLLDRILALDPLFPDDLLDEMRKELSDG